ncbi:hypothetical protein [Variovorax sp. LjRoot178]|uniref:hypothetical protein n=1 Tax=Variovorax sp. LjRoot178 TaxID=3342277 RepID=UPI003F50F9A8
MSSSFAAWNAWSAGPGSPWSCRNGASTFSASPLRAGCRGQRLATFCDLGQLRAWIAGIAAADVVLVDVTQGIDGTSMVGH